MINIILDTNILHQEGLASRNMQLLKRLILAGEVEIYIPELVKREFLTRRIMESTEKVKETYNSLSFVIKKINKDNELYSKVMELQKSTRNIEDCLETEITCDFNKWVQDYKATILPIEGNCINEVFDEYFLGAGVYRKPKSREDIPDAIICYNIKRLLTNKENLIVIIKDGAFKKHLNTIEDINVLDSLDEFLDLHENKTKLEQLDALSAKTESIKEYLTSQEFIDNLLEYLVKSRELIEGIYLEEDQVRYKELLGIDSFGERVNFPRSENIRDLHIRNVACLSDGIFSLEVTFVTNASLDFCGEYSDYMALAKDANRSVTSDSMNGDGICDLAESRCLKFIGYLQLNIEDILSVEELKIHCKYLGAEKCVLGIDLEIDSAEILRIPNKSD